MNNHFDFYPRPPRGGRRPLRRVPVPAVLISIHALREEGDVFLQRTGASFEDFYPRPPRGGRPKQMQAYMDKYDFYPRPPRGGRQNQKGKPGGNGGFLSTPSARRATAKTETKALFSNKLYNILHEFRRALIYNGSKSYPNHAK